MTSVQEQFESDQPLEPLDPFNPFEPLNPIRRRPVPKRPFKAPEGALKWIREPLMDVFEEEKAIKIYAEVQSEDEDDIQINVTAGKAEVYRSLISEAEGFGEVWKIVKDTVKDSLGKHRVGMMLFLDDLPLHLGAYHPLGTNNIVLNRTLVQIVEAATKSKQHVNGFVYSLLVHEYLHALGHVPEAEVRSLVYKISRECFGENHIVTSLAEKSPWALLKGIPLRGIEAPRRAMEIVKDFEKPNQGYIV